MFNCAFCCKFVHGSGILVLGGYPKALNVVKSLYEFNGIAKKGLESTIICSHCIEVMTSVMVLWDNHAALMSNLGTRLSSLAETTPGRPSLTTVQEVVPLAETTPGRPSLTTVQEVVPLAETTPGRTSLTTVQEVVQLAETTPGRPSLTTVQEVVPLAEYPPSDSVFEFENIYMDEKEAAAAKEVDGEEGETGDEEDTTAGDCCGITFSNLQKLQDHYVEKHERSRGRKKKSYSNVVRIACVVCKQDFPRSMLYRHYKKNHVKEEIPAKVKCPTCQEYIVFSSYTYKKHWEGNKCQK